MTKEDDAKDARIRELKGKVKALESEVRRLKAPGLDEKDILAILDSIGVEHTGSKRAWTEFWRDVMYPNRSRGLAQKEMAVLCKELKHPWGREPIRRAVKLLYENKLLVKKRTHYVPDLEYISTLKR